MPRTPLPARRQNETFSLRHQGHAFTVTVGYDPAGRPREVFADTSKAGTELAHMIADACVIISLALQCGVAPADLVKSLGRVPDLDEGRGACRPASALGSIMAIIVSARPAWADVMRAE